MDEGSVVMSIEEVEDKEDVENMRKEAILKRRRCTYYASFAIGMIVLFLFILVGLIKKVKKNTEVYYFAVMAFIICIIDAFFLFIFQRQVMRQSKRSDLTAVARYAQLDVLGISCLTIDAHTHNILKANKAAFQTFQADQCIIGTHISNLIDNAHELVSNSHTQDTQDTQEKKNSLLSKLPSWSQLLQHSPTEKDSSQFENDQDEMKEHKPQHNKQMIISASTNTGRKLKLVAYSTQIVQDTDDIEKIFLVFHDVSQVLETSYKLEVQQKLMNQFAHELRNKISGAFEVLQSWYENPHEDNEDFRTRVLASTAELDEADQLIRTRLCIYKVMNGQYIPDWQILNLTEFMTERIHMAASLSRHSIMTNRSTSSSLESTDEGVVYSVSIQLPTAKSQNTIAVWVKTDLFMLSHIANNLLSNARKATNYGLIEFILLEERDGYLEFAVRDTGLGMSPKLQAMLFHGGAGMAEERGVGLGLESCRVFARVLGGDVYLYKSEPNHGSEFRFILPGSVVSIENDNISPRPCLQKLPSPEKINMVHIPKQLQCILVDDSALLRRSLRAKLNSVAKAIPNAQFHFRDYTTIEAILPDLHSLVQSSEQTAIFIDQNYEAAGGCLKGTHLVRALVDAHFSGLIVSASGDDESGIEHMTAGAAVKFCKPYPSAKKMHTILNEAFYDLQQK
eukprot:CAMPEP_0197289978 /NCGR_PEP_ID=MMETSP0890-20130614/7235_1 /TAXON_ID=44058 ORGANISM="Aureoumbra lagunensis, Strain CCMP1510" /NCGR_SAMPLE_ID=MMETSP0890 /ASSEMBLY_ACC=CAM_ASM_000533 /LENGTH=678 /DNA_ID=CAMNT_0042761719 /DNA_START=118 /DNA_END=2154 /DNA_ORIENTATION=-